MYLTDAERDLVRGALDFVTSELAPGSEGGLYRVTIWARSATRKRLIETRALFEDKATQEPTV